MEPPAGVRFTGLVLDRYEAIRTPDAVVGRYLTLPAYERMP